MVMPMAKHGHPPKTRPLPTMEFPSVDSTTIGNSALSDAQEWLKVGAQELLLQEAAGTARSVRKRKLL